MTLVAVVVTAIVTAVVTVAVCRRAIAPTIEPPSAVPEVDRLRAVLDGLPAGLVLGDANGAVTFRNAAARRLAGTHAGVIIDETVERHLAGATPETQSEELVELYGPPRLVVVVRAAAIPGGGAFVLIEDITERRRIDSVRTDFVANISHELKTPVGALAVLAETLVDEPDPEVIQRLAGRLLDEAHRAARTIDDLLELSRIELGGGAVQESVDACAVVLAAIERAEPLAEQRSIEISVLDRPEGAPALHVDGDRRQLVSAVGNLVENAVKYSEPRGRVQVRVRREGAWIEFQVADHGVGIPARDLDRIFERFYRVDKARSRGTGGSGLGLSIVRHVATNHGGDVLVSSREGEGSTFVLRIPSGDRDELGDERRRPETPASERDTNPPPTTTASATSTVGPRPQERPSS